MRIACFPNGMEFLGKGSEGLMDHNSFVPVGEVKQGWRVPFFPMHHGVVDLIILRSQAASKRDRFFSSKWQVGCPI